MYDRNATANLRWGDLKNLHDFREASPGQWFLGVLDTGTKAVYLLPSDIHPCGQEPRINTYASKPPLPSNGWKSLPKWFGDGINSRPGPAGAMRQHVRMCIVYGLEPSDCLGFSMVKINNDFAQYRDFSNSLNGGKPNVTGQSISPGYGANGGTWRMPPDWSQNLLRFLKIDISNIAASN